MVERNVIDVIIIIFCWKNYSTYYVVYEYDYSSKNGPSKAESRKLL